MKSSVVIATYNGEQYIEDQIRSILFQTIKPDEIVICDDSSNDKTVTILNTLLTDTHINYKIIQHKMNLGVVNSFRDALFEASGNIIFLCDQDDVWERRKIEIFLDVFEKNKDCILAFSNAKVTDDKLAPLGKSLWDSIHFNPDRLKENIKSDLVSELLKRNIFTGMCMSFRKELINEDTIFPSYMLHDEYLGWKALHTGKIIAINEQLVLYRQHSNNAVGISNIRKFQSVHLLKEYVRNSSIKTFNKFNELLQQSDDNSINLLLNDALDFYNKRIQLYEMKKISALMQLLALLKNDGYKRYTSKTERAFVKDIAYIIL